MLLLFSFSMVSREEIFAERDDTWREIVGWEQISEEIVWEVRFVTEESNL